MHYGSFAKWYVAKLKAQPLLVNVSSGLLLMSTGDVLAQRVEIGSDAKHQQQQQQMITSTSIGETSNSSSLSPASLFLQATDVAYQTLQDEIASFGWDKSRTAKMAAWSVMFTPFYVGIFKMYDRYLPKKNLPSIAARVGFSFLSSIPINFAFYSYGNFVQHTADWYAERQQHKHQQQARLLELQRQQQKETATSAGTGTDIPVFLKKTVDVNVDVDVNVPYRFDQLVKKTQQKLEAELVNTIKTSATFWIPLNFVSFSVMPSHLQPMTIMFFSVFWNCYLSMSQHREIVLPLDDDDMKEKDDDDNEMEEEATSEK